VETKERESREEERGREAIVTRKRSGEPGFFLSTIYLTNYIVIARFFGLKNSMPGQWQTSQGGLHSWRKKNGTKSERDGDRERIMSKLAFSGATNWTFWSDRDRALGIQGRDSPNS
jgi:hypothetical protein